jgi:hypothetical protein
MFYGFKSEKELKKSYPALAGTLISISTQHEINICSRGKKCTGSMDGIYIYYDGTRDSGEISVIHTAKLGNRTFRWSKNTKTSKN